MNEKKFSLMQSVAKHELGHWFAAKHFGFNEDYIRILFSCGYDGTISHNAYAMSFPVADLPDINDVYTYLTRRIICLQSGVIAEFLNVEKGEVDIEAVEEAIKETASNDYKQINELVNIARGIKFAGDINKNNQQEQIQQVMDECWCQALEIVNDKYSYIEKMAKEMANQLVESYRGIKFENSQLLELM